MAEGRPAALRFRVPPGVVAFDDVVRGHVEIDTSALGGDFVIVRADGTPLYHFTVVVDDAAMDISHVIRGEDHLSNTPKHILLFRALGHPVPAFAHLPLILNPDRTKMSKRKSQTAMDDYVAQGFIREALVNYLAFLGWSTGTEEEILPLDEIVARFDLAAVNRAGAVFDRDRLEWLNGQWIRRLDPDDLAERLLPFLEADAILGNIDRIPTLDEVRTIVPLVQERLPVLGAIGEVAGFLFVEEPPLDPALIVPKRWDAATTADGLAAARDAIAANGEVSFDAQGLEATLRALAEARGWKAGDLFMAIRVAVTGRTATPPLFETLVALGYARALARLDRARDLVAGMPDPPGATVRPDGPARAARLHNVDKSTVNGPFIRGPDDRTWMSRSILVVDDERTVRETVGETLEAEGFRVTLAADGREALERFRADRPDLILLDLMLPELSGVEVCRIIRSEADVPIIMLTAKGGEVDKVVGLELGADDYVTKPFSLRELVARVRAVFRRSDLRSVAERPAPLVDLGTVQVDLAGHRILRDGLEVPVKPKVFELVAFLLRHPGQVFTREQLLERVWGYDYAGETRTVDVHIHWARTAVEVDPANPTLIQTVRGVGYVLRRPG